MIKPLFISFVMYFLSNCVASEEKIITNSLNHKSKLPKTNLENSIERGNALYQDFCVQCHMTTGKGLPNAIPPLDGYKWLGDNRKRAIYATKYGQKGEVLINEITYNGIMPPMGLSNNEVADVLNYVMNSWGNSGKEMISAEEVSAVEK